MDSEYGEAPRAEVLVRTFAPNTNANYGGVLQAWAMHRVISGIGFDAYVDGSRLPRHRPNSMRSRAKSCFQAATPLLERCGPALPPSLQRRMMRRELGREITEFALRRIPLVRLFDERGRVRDRVLDRFDAFVVGSDQVWRPEYSDIRSFLLDFLPEGDARPRLSYAASFGVDAPTFSISENSAYGRLAENFSGVSVREASGVAVAKEMWGVAAVQHVDPTMLVGLAEYNALAQEARDPLPPGRVVSYVLDRTEPSIVTESSVSAALDEPCFRLMPEEPVSVRQWKANPGRYQRPSVEAWVGSIHGARFLVTDSFHGAVFAILGNIPFIAVCNRVRGATRFESLLSRFGLLNRLVEPGTVITQQHALMPIDWDRVNERIAVERERSVEYLGAMLRPLSTAESVAVTA